MTLPQPLAGPLARVLFRMRLQRALNAALLMLLIALGVAALALGLVKVGWLAVPLAWRLLAGCIALPFAGAAVGALRPASTLGAAQILDRRYDLQSRLSNAVDFLQLAEGERTPFIDASIEDALHHAGGLRASEALPIRAPRDTLACAALAALVATIALFELPTREAVAPPKHLAPLLVYEDDLGAFQSELDPILAASDASPDLQQAAEKLNRILEDLADRRLERGEALEQIRDLEEQLGQISGLGNEALDASLKELGKELEHAETTTAAAEALNDADADSAAEELSKAADSMKPEAMSKKELDRLRDALSKAGEERKSQGDLTEKREELERLLEQERDKQASTPEEKRLLQQRKRELDRLRREEQRMREQQRALDRLRRELQQAAEALGQQQNQQAADAMNRSAEALNRIARQQMDEEQMQQLARQLRQLRELIRRQQQAGGGQQGQQGQQGQRGGHGQRMKRFVLGAGGQGTPLRIAGGQQGQGQGQQGQGQQGQGQQGQGQQGQGQQGQGQQGQGQQGQQGQTGGQGQRGRGQGGEVLTLGGQGQGNAILEMPGMGQAQQSQGSGQQGPGGMTGSGAGSEHDPAMADDPTHLKSKTQDTRVEGAQGEGPTRSEVIFGSAERGFVAKGYRQVHADYQGHAEEVLERDEVPPGYRFYVRRYFQLIRPREGSP